jgi:prevent-host-death family protein
MARSWQLQEAKAKFSELVQEALTGEAQFVTRYGEQAVVVLDVASYQRLLKRDQSVLTALMGDCIDDEVLDMLNMRDYLPSRELDLFDDIEDNADVVA